MGALGRRLRRLDVRALRGRPLEDVGGGEDGGEGQRYRVKCDTQSCGGVILKIAIFHEFFHQSQRQRAVWCSQGPGLLPGGRWVVLPVGEGP